MRAPEVVACASRSLGPLENEEATVAAWIRRRRLEAARRDLVDPALRSSPIHAVAARWGFPRAADFSRAFRRAYDITPNECRSRAAAADKFPRC
ncbi:helix-turn-helix domain-containing protein [Streptomyces sp. NPDC058247]|uniref:helix-turn-helix domain-containing protein n=1 Tax=Streptomyces sp. NPDC058247 TaxID=3346401 RepID=UPI0036F055FA